MRGNFRKILLAGLLLSLPVLLYLAGTGWQAKPPLSWYSRTVWVLTAPLIRGIRSVEEGLSGSWRHYIFLVRTEARNQQLNRNLQKLELEKTFWESVANENKRLTSLLDFKARLPFETLAARILSYPPLDDFRQMVVDRGRADGVERGAVVVVPEGLVGWVTSVQEKESVVLLIVDPTSVVEGRVVRSGARGLINGRGMNVSLERKLFIGALEYWDQSLEVEEGDRIVTSGLDGVFPPDLPIGTVRNLRRPREGLFLEGEVIPAVSFQKLREVLIVKR